MIDFKVGYSSPAESGIMDELGLSLAEVCETSMLLWVFLNNYFYCVSFSFLLDEELSV